MKQFIKRYCAEIATALFIIAVVLFVAPFVFRMQSAAGCYMLDAVGVCVALALCVGIIADTTRDTAPDADADTPPAATPEYNAEGELVVNGRGVFDPFTTTLGDFLRWFFGWDNPSNVFPYRVPRNGDELTPATLRDACKYAGFDVDKTHPVGWWLGLRAGAPSGETYETMCAYIRAQWDNTINVEVFSDVKELVYVFTADGETWEVDTPHYWGAPIE